jgi:hypothetical protein
MRLFRERLLARLIEKHASSQELGTCGPLSAHEAHGLEAPGFSAHVGETNFETMDPLEWPEWRIASRTPGKHRTLFYGYYANQVRVGLRRSR